ncbi:hypothetical protein GT037_010612 [Alternaria burnsii]|uniref:Uncharacterized protein n=1 Tax=Alternaria burnsii TaxID=1187904 RepID=A0A8H7EAE4_9PLEO|nr:uncharacterized protein GT037_010612 [Alternaria burnsii]KAF7671287.1 hypothetical protein GT037_010612 [Alternaria burnsii]
MTNAVQIDTQSNQPFAFPRHIGLCMKLAVYANKIKNDYFQQSDFGSQNKIFIPPINSQAVLASGPIKQSQTNFGVFRASDPLLEVDNPSFTPSNDGYAQRCLNYLTAVQLDTDASAGLVQIRDEAYKRLSETSQNFQAIAKKAKAAWQDSFDYPGTPLYQWIIQNYPMYAAAENDQNAASSAYNNVMNQIYRSNYMTLEKMKRDLQLALAQQSSAYTMIVNAALPEAADNTVADEYRPKYDIDAGYAKQVKAWIDQTVDRDNKHEKASIVINASDTSNYDWHSVGFDESKIDASGGFWPFFRVEYNESHTKQYDDVKVDESSSGLSVKIVADGISSFAVNPSSTWNPGNIKKTYPNLYKSASKQLWDPMVQVSKIVVGYNVRIEISLDSNAYKSITSKVDTALSRDANASATLFGCRLDLGGSYHNSESNSTKWSDVKKDDGSNTFVIPASNNAMPVLLAVVGTVLS